MTETYYDVLGVDADADADAIDMAYRERVKEWHPDVSDRPNAAERFKRIQRAEAVLTDPVERRRYDRLGHEAYANATSGPGGRDPPDADAGERSTTTGAATTSGESDHDAGTGSARAGPGSADAASAETDASAGGRSADRASRDGADGTDGGTREGSAGRTTGGRGSSRGAEHRTGTTGRRKRDREGATAASAGQRATSDDPDSGRSSAGRAESSDPRWSYRAAGGSDPWATGTGPGPNADVAGDGAWGAGSASGGPEFERLLRGWLPPRDRHPWLRFLSVFGSGRLLNRRHAVGLGALLLYPYPFLLVWGVEALLSGPVIGDLVATVLVGTLLTVTVVVSGIPNVGVLFFGSWGVVIPALLVRSPAAPPITDPFSIGVVAACWLPVVHSVVVVGLMWRDGEFL